MRDLRAEVPKAGVFAPTHEDPRSQAGEIRLQDLREAISLSRKSSCPYQVRVRMGLVFRKKTFQVKNLFVFQDEARWTEVHMHDLRSRALYKTETSFAYPMQALRGADWQTVTYTPRAYRRGSKHLDDYGPSSYFLFFFFTQTHLCYI